MRGNYYYTNKALLAAVILASMAGCIWLTVSFELDAKLMGIVTAPLVIFLSFVIAHVPCSYYADRKSVVIRSGLAVRRFKLSDIREFNIEDKESGSGKYGAKFFRKVLRIHTAHREYIFREDGWLITNDDIQRDPQGVESSLKDTELDRLADFLRTAKESGGRTEPLAV